MINIQSHESLDCAVAEIVRLKIRHTEAVARMDAEIAALQKKHQTGISELLERISAEETDVRGYCEVHRAELFPDKKSRESLTAVFGFELTPWRVEPIKKLKFAEVIERLARLPWGKVYLRQPKIQLDKEALLKDRERIKDQHCIHAGFQFSQEEQFFIRPKAETAEDTTCKP